MNISYKQQYTYGMDYGTSYFKYGPIILGETAKITENRGYFPDKRSLMNQAFGGTRNIIVGEDIPIHLQASDDLSERLVYPMKNGVIENKDEKAWKVVEEITRHALEDFPSSESEFKGFYLVSSLSSISPKYMYERFFDIYKRIDGGIIKAATIIPQPLAVAIAHKVTTCVVIESGHGNTQVCPISKYPIRNAIVAINRGGGDANALTSEILKDLGYSDLAREEAFVIRAKESLGLIPKDLDKALRRAKEDPKRYSTKFKMPGTRIEVDLGKESWLRFLIGEYPFNPNNGIFESYFNRGMPKPKDVKIGDLSFKGMSDFGDAVIEAVERCPIELQPYLYRSILLSGGNFCWNSPHDGKDAETTDPSTKIRLLLRKKGITNIKVSVTEQPQFSVWRGCVTYGYAVPEDYPWSWDRLEGWMYLEDSG